jgi:hypothetical protein
VRPGHTARLGGEVGPADGVVYFANAHAIGVRTGDALYRFLRGFAKPVIAARHLFGEGAGHAIRTEPDPDRQAWEAWLRRTLA